MTDFFEKECGRALSLFYLYYVPFVIITGVLGNLTSCVVFMCTHLKSRSSSYYLAALAISDTTYLITIFIYWLDEYTSLSKFDEEGWCQGLRYISKTCGFVSAWITVAFTVERFIAVQYPLRMPQWCTVARAKVTILMITIFGLVFRINYVVMMGVVSLPGHGEMCDVKPEYLKAGRNWSVVDMVMSLMIPAGVIVVLNVMIARHFVSCSKDKKPWSFKLKRRDAESSTAENQSSQHSSSTIVRSDDAGEPMVTTLQEGPQKTNDDASNKVSVVKSSVSVRTQRSITKMLLLISTVFVVLNTPCYVNRFLMTLMIWKQGRTVPSYLWCVQRYFFLLFYTNFSINFLLYSVCGSTFRACFMQLVRKFAVKLKCCCSSLKYR